MDSLIEKYRIRCYNTARTMRPFMTNSNNLKEKREVLYSIQVSRKKKKQNRTKQNEPIQKQIILGSNVIRDA